MAIALISSAQGGGTNGATTSAIDTTGATLLVVQCSYWVLAGPLTGPTDSRGNTWAALTSYATNSNPSVRFWYCVPTSVGSGHTFSVAGSNIYPAIFAAAFSGTATTSPFDTEAGTASVAAGTSRQPGSVTPATGGSLILSGVTIDAAYTSPAIDSGLSILQQRAYTTGASMGGAMGYLIQGSAAAINPTWSWTPSRNNRANIAAFKPASGGVAASPYLSDWW